MPQAQLMVWVAGSPKILPGGWWVLTLTGRRGCAVNQTKRPKLKPVEANQCWSLFETMISQVSGANY